MEITVKEEPKNYFLQMKNITKYFGKFKAFRSGIDIPETVERGNQRTENNRKHYSFNGKQCNVFYNRDQCHGISFSQHDIPVPYMDRI